VNGSAMTVPWLTILALVPLVGAVVLMGVFGIGNTLVDVAGVTLLQRAVPDEVLGRVFGALESLLVAGLAAGALVAPILIHTFGIRTALIATGATSCSP